MKKIVKSISNAIVVFFKSYIKEWFIYAIVKAIIFAFIVIGFCGLVYFVKDYVLVDKSFWIAIGIGIYLLQSMFDVYVKVKLLRKNNNKYY